MVTSGSINSVNGVIVVPNDNRIKYIRLNGGLSEIDNFKFFKNMSKYTGSNAIVTQDENHTLIAIWDANS